MKMFARGFSISALGLLLLAAVAGCSLLGDPLEKAAEGGGKLVKYYCKNVSVPEVRAKIRERVNFYAAPDSVQVTCAEGGPALTAGSSPARSGADQVLAVDIE